MLSRCLLLILALCFLMDELYAFLLPDRLRLTRSTYKVERDLSSHLSELSDLVEFIPDNGGEMTRDWEPNPARSSVAFSPIVERISSPLTNSHRHKNKDKRLRVTVPLDRIGSSYLSNRNRKEEPEEKWEKYNQ